MQVISALLDPANAVSVCRISVVCVSRKNDQFWRHKVLRSDHVIALLIVPDKCKETTISGAAKIAFSQNR